MYILLKLMAALVAFFYRHLRGEPVSEGHTITVNKTDGTFGYEKSKHGIRATLLSFPLESDVIFKLTEESFLDGIIKLVGLAEEVQTGDGHFDKLIYIASDDRKFTRHLIEMEELRKLTIDLVNDRSGEIYCHGKHLVFKFKGDLGHDREMWDLAERFHQLVSLIDRKKTRLIDEFGPKVLFVESFVYSLSIYALTGAFEFYVTKRSIYLYDYDLIVLGLKWGGVIAILLLGFIAFFLQRSSRGGRVLVESAVVLGLSLPVGGINLVADINRVLDKEDPIVLMKNIKQVQQHKHRTRRRVSYTYSMTIDGSTRNDPIHVPTKIEINREDYNRAAGSSQVRLEIGKGRLKKPYYRNFMFY